MTIALFPRPSHVRSNLRTNALAALAVLAIGLLTGVGTQVLQGHLPGAWSVIANSAAAWALAAFAVGALMPTRAWAAGGGAAALVIASVGYYRAVEVLDHVQQGWHSTTLWSMVSLVSGSVFGYAGWIARNRADRRPLSLALVAGALAAEGAHLVWFVGNRELRPAGIVEIALAAVIGAVAHFTGMRRRAPVAAVIAGGVVLTWAGFQAVSTGLSIGWPF